MTTITLKIPDIIFKKIWKEKEMLYEDFIIKTIWREYISPDLEFIDYENMPTNHKEEFDKLQNINKSELLNI